MTEFDAIDTVFVGALDYDVTLPRATNSLETTSLSDLIRIEIGGGASITAIALATFGMSTAVVGSVGKDASIIFQELKESKVVPFLKVNPKLKTAVTVVEHYEDGKKRYNANTTSNHYLYPEDLKEAYSHVARSKLVMRTGYPWMPQIAGQPTVELFEYAKEKGVMTALDMSNPNSWERKLLEELISDVLPQVNLLCANERELYRLARRPNEPQVDNSELEAFMDPERSTEYAHRLIEKGVKIVNLHYGPRGTILITKEDRVHAEPSRIFEYIYPTGTGNLQNAGVIYSMLRGNDFTFAAAFANAAALLRLEGTGFPTLEQVKSKMRLS